MCAEGCNSAPRQSLGGALVVLSSSPSHFTSTTNHTSSSSSSCSLLNQGHLVFHTPSSTGSATTATHATFTPSPEAAAAANDTYGDSGNRDIGVGSCRDFIVGIHRTGNLLNDNDGSGFSTPDLLHKFRLRIPSSDPTATAVTPTPTTMKLPIAGGLELPPGGAGVIGRRVSVWRCEDTAVGGRFGISSSNSSSSSSGAESSSDEDDGSCFLRVTRGMRPLAEGIVGFN